MVTLVPTHHDALEPVLREELDRLDLRIRSATNREKRVELHGYSRLLDLERLLYLLRLLSCFPDLEAIVSPLPEGDVAERAAAFLQRLHGDCYGDAAALRADLAWLEQQGFTSAQPVVDPIQLAPLGSLFSSRELAALPTVGGVNGGHPPMGDAQVFIRVFSLLRHVLQHPLDRERGSDLPAHLIEAMEEIPGASFNILARLPAGSAEGQPNSRRFRPGQLLWDLNLISRLLAVIETPAAMDGYLLRAQSQDDAKRRAHRCVEAAQEAARFVTARGWLKA